MRYGDGQGGGDEGGVSGEETSSHQKKKICIRVEERVGKGVDK